MTVPPRRAGSRVELHVEAGRVREVDQQLRLPERVLADALDADLLDEVVARRRRVVRSRTFGVPVRKRAAPVAYSISSSKRERPLVRLPAGVRRLEPLREIRVARRASRSPGPPQSHFTEPPTAKSTPSAVTSSGTMPGRLVAVEDHVRADLVRAAHDRLDVLDLRLLEEHVADRDEQRALVDRSTISSSSSQTTTSRSGWAW